MDDIEEVIKRAEHYRFEDEPENCLLNRISSLPASKAKLKRSIKERIKLLAASYISLASFVSDEDADFLIESYGSKDKKKLRRKLRILKSVVTEMKKLKNKIKDFDPFDAFNL